MAKPAKTLPGSYCANCGSKFSSEKAKFCTSCGEPREALKVEKSEQDFPTLFGLVELIDKQPSEELSSDEEVLYRRLVLVYPNETIFFYAAEAGWYLSNLSAELPQKAFKEYAFLPSAAKFKYDPEANGWVLTNAKRDVVEEVIASLDQNLGLGELALPLINVAKRITTESSLEDYLDEMGHAIEEDPEDEDPDRAGAVEMFNSYKKLAKKKIQTQRKLIACGATEYLPKYSAYGRFESFFEILEDEYGWAMDYNECCGNCAQSFREELEVALGQDSVSIFVTWGQNAEHTWKANGSTSHFHITNSPQEANQIQDAANRCDLNVTKNKGPETGFSQLVISLK